MAEMIARHVVSFELAKRLMAAGFPQECYFAWFKDDHERIVVLESEAGDDSVFLNRQCAAPMLSEIMERVPAGTEARAWRMLDNVLVWHALARFDKPDVVEEMMNYGTTGPDAAAALWLALKEGK